MTRTARPIFIVGCQRSGTTLLRLMLDSHARIACGPETRFLTGFETITGEDWHRISRFGLSREQWLAKTSDFFASFQEEYAAGRGKARWADKSPLYAVHLPYIWELFPDAQVIHVIRDVRDVTLSHRSAYGYKSAVGAPRKWSRYVASARAAAGAVGPDQYLELRFEDLVADPEAALRGVLEFLGEPWDPNVLEHDKVDHDVNPRYWKRTGERRKSVPTGDSPVFRARRRTLDPVLRSAVYVSARGTCRELGYDGGLQPKAPAPPVADEALDRAPR